MLYEMLVSAASESPGREAVEAHGTAVSYGELRAAVDGFASKLGALGFGKGDPVLVLLPNGAEFVIAVFAAAKLGGIVVPVNLSFQINELKFYLQDSGARAVVTTAKLASRHGALIQDVNPGCHIVTSIPRPDSAPLEAAAARASIDGDVLYQYSSGSTGTPKRVVRSQANLVEEADNYTHTVKLTREDRILAVVPMFHAHGFGNCLLATIRAGATLYTLESFNRQQVIDALVDKDITVFPGVPFMFSILADSPSIAAARLPALRLAFSAGAPLADKTFERFLHKFGVPVRQLYGSTETGSVAINMGRTAGDLWSSVGQAIHHVEVKIVDDDGQPAGVDQTGEIIIRSQAMTRGYANLEEVNRQSFRDGYFWSGDLGRLDRDGRLFISGRKTLFINVGGNKVDPAQIEALIDEHPAVAESVVLGVGGGHSQEIIKAVVVCKQACDAEQIRVWCRGKVADFKVPRIVEFRAEIPRSPLGKILRKYLQDEESH